MPQNKDWKNNKFDLDLAYGHKGENKVLEMLEGNKVEGKTERKEMWIKNGNIAIEISYRGKPSGLSTTTADGWVQLLDGGFGGFIFKTSELKRIVEQKLKSGIARKVMGGDDNQSELVLIPIDKVFTREPEQKYVGVPDWMSKAMERGRIENCEEDPRG